MMMEVTAKHMRAAISAQKVRLVANQIRGMHVEKAEQLLKDKFGIDTSKYGLSYMVAFGYRKEEPREKVRRAFDDIITWK